MESIQTGNEQMLIRTSVFGGFDKKEVLEYIDSLRAQNKQMTEQLESQLCEISDARNALANQAFEFKEKISAMEENLNNSRGRIDELTGMIDTLRKSEQKTSIEKEETNRTLLIERERSRQLAVKAQDFEDKAKKYDNISTDIGNIILEARDNASHIILQAQEQAEGITQNAVEASSKACVELKSLKKDIESIRGNIEELMNSFSLRLDSINEIIDGTSTEQNIEVINEEPQNVVNEENFFRSAAGARE